MSKTECFGLPFDDAEPEEIVQRALELIGKKSGAYVVTPNPEIVLAAEHHSALRQALLDADLMIPDGVGLVWASKILGKPLRHRLPGIDFASMLLEKLKSKHGSVYLLGAKPGVAREAADHLSRQFPDLCFIGTHHGYFSNSDEPFLMAEIQRSRPDLLFVCLGSPRQELWMAAHRSELPGTLMIGLGGALDVFAGRIPRAPLRWRRFGLEWLYRLFREPKRIKRMIRLPGILRAAIRERGRS